MIVQNSGNNVLPASGNTKVGTWVQGHIWQNGANNLGSKDISSLTPSRPSGLVNQDGTYFQMTRPNYIGMTQIDVTTLGLVGDGKTDNAKVLQAALNAHANTGNHHFYTFYLICD